MFQKLLKHEFAVNRSLFTILCLSMLGGGVLGSIALHFLIQMGQNQNAYTTERETSLMVIGIMILALFLVAVFIAIAGLLVFMGILLVYRFYKRHFTDEGYLTFTLPATTHQVLLSSIVNILLWSLITTIVGLVAYGIMFLPAFLTAGEFDVNIWKEMHYAMRTVFGDGYWLCYWLLIVCGALGTTILPLLSITIGAQVAKKHKLLAGFGIYYGLNVGISFITGIISFLTVIGDAVMMDRGGTMFLSLLLPALLYLAIGVGGYFLMHYLVQRKLNLT